MSANCLLLFFAYIYVCGLLPIVFWLLPVLLHCSVQGKVGTQIEGLEVRVSRDFERFRKALRRLKCKFT